MNNLNQKEHLPKQHQDTQPGHEKEMFPRPVFMKNNTTVRRLNNKVAIITGGDSGIGRAVAIAYAKEGCNLVIVYLNEHEDATETAELAKQQGVDVCLYDGDLSDDAFCKHVADETFRIFHRLDILVNNAGVQFPQENILKITKEQLELTFKVNIFSFFYLTQAALKYMKSGAVIINSASITAYKGHPILIDYSSTKGAIVAFTRSLSLSLVSQGIRVNAVAPGPIWTPLIPASFSEETVEKFGKDVPMNRVGQPSEVAACYLFLATDDSSYMSGQVLHPNGGVIVNG